jgi:hypothetical protein
MCLPEISSAQPSNAFRTHTGTHKVYGRGRRRAGAAAGTNNALNALGGVFGVAILAAILAAHGSYATHVTFINGFRPAEWAAAGSSALGVIAAALAPSRSASAVSGVPLPGSVPPGLLGFRA